MYKSGKKIKQVTRSQKNYLSDTSLLWKIKHKINLLGALVR